MTKKIYTNTHAPLAHTNALHDKQEESTTPLSARQSNALPNSFTPAQTSAEVAALWHTNDTPLAAEKDCLALIDSLFPSTTVHNPLGRGDDCAELLIPQRKIALSTDFFWENSHFRTRYFTPQEVGAKALTVAISDLAGAGALPLGFSLGLMLPRWVTTATLKAILEGMSFIAHKYTIDLTGGDLSQGETLGFCCTVWGCSAQPDYPQFFSRNQAAPDDIIFIAGDVGLARTGLLLLEAQGREAMQEFPHAVAAHLAPTPQFTVSTALATHFAQQDTAKHISLMDMSDGLAQDLPRLLGAYGANLQLTHQCIHPEIHRYATLHGISPQELYMLGGEDFALLGTCPPHLWEQLLLAAPSCKAIGTVTAQPELCINDAPFTCQGFDHFRLR